MAQNKTPPSKAKTKLVKAAPPVPKGPLAKGTSAKPAKAAPAKAVAAKPTSKPSAPKVTSTTVAKSVSGAGATIKKPLPAGKVLSSATPAKLAAKPTTPKVEMPQAAAKKIEANKAPVAKPTGLKPSGLKPTVTTPVAKNVMGPTKLPLAKPHVAPMVKPQVAAAVKPPTAALKPAVAGVRPVAPIVPASAVQPPLFRPAVSGGFAKPGAPRPGFPGAMIRPPMIAPKPPVAAAPAADAGPKKPVSSRHGFKTNEWIVYPAHGVGRIVAIDEQEIAGMALELFVISFEKDKLTLRVPTGKAQQVGMRKLAEDGVVKRALETLKGKARIKRTMWSRRAQEFEAKINSGDIVSIAEVVRDLYRAENQPEQSYSERQLYEAALDRMAREIAAVDKIDERTAVQRVVEVLSKSAKGRKAAGEEAAAAAAATGDDEATKAA